MSKVHKTGYTLIEILVGITIVGILFIVGFAGFRDFSNRQAVEAEARKMLSVLSLAREKALSGEKPNSPYCNSPNVLSGYRFSQSQSGSAYIVEAVCSGGSVPITQVTLPSGMSLYSPYGPPVLFKILGQGTDINTSLTADVRYQIIRRVAKITYQSRTVVISPGGQVSEE